MTEEEIFELITKQKERDNLIRENAAKFAEEFENSSTTINKKSALFGGFKFGAYWAGEHPYTGGKELLYVAQKTTERTKKEIINKACEWLEENTNPVFYSGNGWTTEEFIDNFKKAMEL